MKFKQIREIKAKHKGLKFNTHLTHMFTNIEWASNWKINLIMKQDIKDLFKYLDDNHLEYFISEKGIHIQ